MAFVLRPLRKSFDGRDDFPMDRRQRNETAGARSVNRALFYFIPVTENHAAGATAPLGANLSGPGPTALSQELEKIGSQLRRALFSEHAFSAEVKFQICPRDYRYPSCSVFQRNDSTVGTRRRAKNFRISSAHKTRLATAPMRKNSASGIGAVWKMRFIGSA